MNPLTLVKRIQQINSREAALGISEGASWHAKYKESAYVYVGGIPFDLTEGDLLAVFAQYGEVVDVNLVRDKGTGKSKGFCFIAYEDQRSTNLAVDNLNGASVLGRIIRVDHVTNYKKKQEEDEEEAQRKREERGVCRAFQKGECNRGASCKFSHNEQRAANTGWGAKDNSRWEQDKYDGPSKGNKSSGNISQYQPDPRDKDRVMKTRSDDKSGRLSKPGDSEGDTKRLNSRSERDPRDQNRRDTEKGSERYEKERNHKDWDRQATEKKSSRHDYEPNLKEDRDRRGRHESSGRYKPEPEPRRQERSEKVESERNQREAHVNNGKEERLRRHELEPNTNEDRHLRGDEKRSRYDRDSSYRHHEEENDAKNRRSHR